MQEINRLIVRLERQLQEEVKAIIHDFLQNRDFHMFNPVDIKGSTVDDLFMYWLSDTVGLVYTRYHKVDGYYTPTLEVAGTLGELLLDYEADIMSQVALPVQFPIAFRIHRIDPLSFVVYGDKDQSVYGGDANVDRI